MTTTLERGTVAPPAAGPPRRWWRWSERPLHWPLTLALVPFPLWWALGLRTLVPIAVTLVMVDQLARLRRRVLLPRGTALWALFLVFVVLGAFMLWVQAPATEGGGGPERLLVWAYRLAWYLAATVTLLWVANLRESELPTRWVYQLLGLMFVWTTVGGLAGVLAPGIDFDSPLEMLMPAGLRNNSLVESIVHPAVADIQNVLGRPEARPKAPFAFANSWGSAMALFLPFFLVSWFRDGRTWQRVLGPVILVVSAVPIIYSLNRGLWGCLVLGALGFVVLQLRGGRTWQISLTVGVLVVGTLAFLLSPLSTVLDERLANQHSNDRRSQLLEQTVVSTWQGSPVVGFGSTRDLQGGFASIASGATPDCPACAVPPLGTQGHLWLVIFSQGFVGAALFLGFFGLALWQCFRCRTTNEVLCTFVLGFLALQLLIYDTLGIPLMTVMIAIGLVTREQASRRVRNADQLLQVAWRRLRGAWPVVTIASGVGAIIGGVVIALTPPQFSTKASILLSNPPVYLATQSETGTDTSQVVDSETFTIDTEAVLLLSQQSLSRTDDGEALRDRVSVTAPPNTRVMVVEVRDGDPFQSARLVEELADSYLLTRQNFLAERRDLTLRELRARIDQLGDEGIDGDEAVPGSAQTRASLEGAVTAVLLTPTTAGEIIRVQDTTVVRRQWELPIVTGAALGVIAVAVGMTASRRWPWGRPGL